MQILCFDVKSLWIVGQKMSMSCLKYLLPVLHKVMAHTPRYLSLSVRVCDVM